MLDDYYRNKLLSVHFGSVEEKRQYHHPESYGDIAVRTWLLLWSMCVILLMWVV